MKLNFKKKVLDNGFTILFEKRNVPVVSVSISLRAGGINEDLREKGISHFIEHMLYKGTKKRSAYDIAKEIELNGGELNGFTAEYVTSFWCKMPSRHLDVALDVLGDMVKNPKFDEKEVEKERRVIFEEIKMRKDSPKHYVMDKIKSLLYTGTLGVDLIGDEKTLKKIDKKKLTEKFKSIYTPNNLILTVVGDCEFDYIVNWAKKNFSSKKKGKIKEPEFGLKNEMLIEKRRGIDQANLVFAFHAPLASDKKNYAADVLITLLAGGMSSRLFREIREKRNLAYSVHGDLDSSKRYSDGIIFVGCDPKNVDSVKDLILKEFEKVSKNLSEKEVRQTKEQLIGNYQISMEDSQGQMVHLLAYELSTKAEDFYSYEKNISNVKLEDVKEIAKKVLSGDYSFVALLPE